eukprot:TRINITY_DN3481_c0_g1_i1.p1 TRINITY_DN3481_c0_g1~~TRINITY_DN3481_c0_g1_i1.p1  ORF type:complete len:254 (-),score=34.16 TRINITY_DN3481_c0_g1_i1:223-984(-)
MLKSFDCRRSLFSARQQCFYVIPKCCDYNSRVKVLKINRRQFSILCQQESGGNSLSTFEDVPLFPDTSGLLGPQVTGETQEKEKDASTKINDVQLKSGKGMDYSVLKTCLLEGEFQKADDETRAKLIELAGDGAKTRGWVYFSEVKTIPAEDLQTMNDLWLASSNGNFGYSVQKQIWKQVDQNWSKFFKKIDWTVGEQNFYRKWPQEFIYSTEAAKGHLPLTNCLRGTQLFQAIMEHPAFETVVGEEVPEWMK